MANMMFGEKHVDNLWGLNLDVEWTPKYEKAREAAIKAMKEFSLSEDDFWIKKEFGPFKKSILYTNLILSHSGCIKINQMQPEEKKFIPSCVEELKGTPNGGVAFIYRSDKQGLIKTGEAMPMNVGCSYPYAVAEKRLFDRVVTALAGLYEEGIYGEEESPDFQQPAATETAPAAPAAQPSPVSTVETGTPAPTEVQATSLADGLTREERIASLKKDIAYTGTDEKVLCDYYGVFSVDELDEKMLTHCEGIIAPRVKKKLAMEKKLVPASQIAAPEPAAKAVTAPPVNTAAMQPESKDGISPVAAMLMGMPDEEPEAKPQMAEAEPDCEEEDLGQTVYRCSEKAPESFLALNGQTFDQIGKDMLRGLYSRKNAAGRRYVDKDTLEKIEAFIAA